MRTFVIIAYYVRTEILACSHKRCRRDEFKILFDQWQEDKHWWPKLGD